MLYRVWTFGDERVFRGVCGRKLAEFFERTSVVMGQRVDGWRDDEHDSIRQSFAPKRRRRDEREVVAVRSIWRGFLRQLDSTRRFRLLRLDRDVRLVRMVTLRCRSDDFYHLPISKSDAKLRVG